VASIHASMREADDAYRKYLDPGFEPVEAEAKKDRATLNRADKNIGERYASLKAAYEKPLARFDLNIREIRRAIKDASGTVDGAVKAYKEVQNEKKRAEIEAYFKSTGFELVSLDMLAAKCGNGEKWLNKGYKMGDIRKDIEGAIGEVYSNIQVLERIGEYGMTAKALYLETLDMAAAMRQVDALKANAERLAREKVEREEREREARIAENRRELAAEERVAAKAERVASLVEDALDMPEPEVPPQPEGEKEKSITVCFTGKEKNLRCLRLLRPLILSKGITYKVVG